MKTSQNLMQRVKETAETIYSTNSTNYASANDAEKALFGLILVGNSEAAAAASTLLVRDYSSTQHGTIQRAINAMRADNIVCNRDALVDQLDNVGQLKLAGGEFGGAEYIIELDNIGATVNPAHITEIIEVIKSSASDSAIKTTDKMAVETVITQQLSRSQRIEQGGDGDKVAMVFFRLYSIEAKNPPRPLIIAKNLPIYPDDRLIVLGSMPAIGKSALIGATTAIELVRQGAHVIICNYEMRHQGSLQRIISCASYGETEKKRIETSAIIRRVADVGEMQEIWDKYITKQPGTLTLVRPENPDELDKIVQAVRDEHSDGKIVIIYDYLQRMPWFSEITEQRLQTKKTLRTIQEIANRVQAHSIVIASVNRSGYGKADMSAYKEAGEIESDADIAVVLTLAKVNKAGEAENIEIMDEIIAERRQPEVTVLVNIVKQRNGQEGQYALKFIKRFQAFDKGPVVSGAFISREEREQRDKEDAAARERAKRDEKAQWQAAGDALRRKQKAEAEVEAKTFKQQPLPGDACRGAGREAFNADIG